MAQTIAAQRGTTTNPSDGSTMTTLFTQSSGIATRVILNGVSWTTTSGGSTINRMALLINVNGTGVYNLVAVKATSNAGRTAYGMNMMPDSRSSAPVTTTGSSAGQYPDRWVMYSTFAGNYLGTNLAGGRWEQSGPNGGFAGMNDFAVDIVPSQFWMNSGDSLTLLTWNNNGYTASVVYSFTTITES